MRRLIPRLMGFGAITMVQKILGFALATQIVALLGASQFGVYAYLLNLANLAATFVVLGFPQLLTRELSVYRASDRADLLAGIRRFSWLVVGSGVVLFALLASFSCARFCKPGAFEAAFWVAIGVFAVVGLTGVQQGILRGLDRVLGSAWPMMLLQPGLLLATVMIARFMGWDAEPDDVLLWFVLAGLAAAITMAAVIRSELSTAQGTDEPPRYTPSAWVSSLVPFFLIGGFTMLMYRSDVLILGIFRPPAEVGHYAIAAQLALLINMPAAIVGLMIEPRLAMAFAKGERAQMRKDFADCAILSGAAALATLLCLAVFGQDILRLFFGVDFVASYTPLMILAAGYSVHAVIGPADSFLSMAGHEKTTMASLGVATVLNVALNFALIPYAGLIGAAIATVIALIVGKFLLALMVFRHLGIAPGPGWYLKKRARHD